MAIPNLTDPDNLAMVAQMKQMNKEALAMQMYSNQMSTESRKIDTIAGAETAKMGNKDKLTNKLLELSGKINY